jgi:predicted restriction endonuclease
MQREYNWEEVEPAVAILESIAAFEDGDVCKSASVVDPPLHHHVDTDALNAIVRDGSTSSIALRIADYRVQVRGKLVEVTDADR